MPKYIVSSDSAISVRELNKPDVPELPGKPEHPEIEPPDLPLPPGIWPPPTPAHPIQPVPPAEEGEDGEKPSHPIELPPGAIWPRPPGPVSGLFVCICHIPNMGWHYVVIDPDAWPKPVDPDYGIEEGTPPNREPKRA